MRILFCAGGTGGHVYPAIAIADAVQKKYQDAVIAFATRQNGKENEAIKEKNYPIYEMNVEGLKREFSLSNVKTVWKLFTSLKQADAILQNFRPDLVIGTGGYVSFPVIFKAQKQGIKTVLHESNAIPGLCVRALSKKVDRIFLNFSGTEAYFQNKNNCVVTGTPVRKELYEKTKREERAQAHVKDEDYLIVSFGGSLGSQKLNDCIIPIMLEEKTQKNIRHIHGVGTRYYPEIQKQYPSLCQKNAKVKLVPFIKNMPQWMKAADLVISRSGASTVSEIATAQTPSILIPSPNVTNNHQYENAKRLADKNAAILIEENELTKERLKEEIEKMKENPNLSALYSRNAIAFSMENAAEKVLNEIEILLS